MSRNIHRTLETHCYTLWRDVFTREDGTFITDDIIISMGEGGVMQSNPAYGRKETREILFSNGRMNNLIEHNMAERERALEEGGKWEIRLKHSPLGRTQQDFVAYYTEVVGVFTAWCTAHGIPLPK